MNTVRSDVRNVSDQLHVHSKPEAVSKPRRSDEAALTGTASHELLEMTLSPD